MIIDLPRDSYMASSAGAWYIWSSETAALP